mmetsp:Transcript_32436/g.89708  ORF Transcript_32436/g.89708 Transcript_32436/m.89708 type:complete len:266 (+) Transcript_32436:2132-2929(+)
MELLDGLADVRGGPTVSVDTLTKPVSRHQDGCHLILQDVQHAARRVLGDDKFFECFVGSDFARPELRAREKVVHGLRVRGRRAKHRRPPHGEIDRRPVAHFLPRSRGDHRLTKLRVRGEGDLPRRHQLRRDEVQTRPRHAKNCAGLVSDVAIAIGVAVQPPGVQHNLRVGRGLEARRRGALGSHHELSEGVAAVAVRVPLQQRQRLVLNLGAAVALDELELHLTLFVGEHEALHGSPGVVTRFPRDVGGPDPGLLVEVGGHEQGD